MQQTTAKDPLTRADDHQTPKSSRSRFRRGENQNHWELRYLKANRCYLRLKFQRSADKFSRRAGREIRSNAWIPVARAAFRIPIRRGMEVMEMEGGTYNFSSSHSLLKSENKINIYYEYEVISFSGCSQIEHSFENT
jgi:hypothetical protein